MTSSYIWLQNDIINSLHMIDEHLFMKWEDTYDEIKRHLSHVKTSRLILRLEFRTLIIYAGFSWRRNRFRDTTFKDSHTYKLYNHN